MLSDMGIVPNLLSHESVLNAGISGVSGLIGWLARWWQDRRRITLSVRIVQNLISCSPSCWVSNKVGDRTIMQLTGHFRITNTTDHPVSILKIETGFWIWKRSVTQPRVIIDDPLDEVTRDRPVPPKTTRDAVIYFELNPPRNWSGTKNMRLSITDSLDNERNVKVTFVQLHLNQDNNASRG